MQMEIRVGSPGVGDISPQAALELVRSVLAIYIREDNSIYPTAQEPSMLLTLRIERRIDGKLQIYVEVKDETAN